jgi:hypothetical protein
MPRSPIGPTDNTSVKLIPLLGRATHQDLIISQVEIGAGQVLCQSFRVARLRDDRDSPLCRPAKEDLSRSLAVGFCGGSDVRLLEEGADELDFGVVELDPAGHDQQMIFPKGQRDDEVGEVEGWEKQRSEREGMRLTIEGRMSSMQ